MERKASTISVDTYCLRFVASLVLSFPITSDGGKVYLLSSKIIEKAKSTGSTVVFLQKISTKYCAHLPSC